MLSVPPRALALAHKHTPFRPLWAVVDASWPPRHPSSHRDSPTAYSGVQQGVARRCVWCRETHIDYWPELEAQAGGRAGRTMEFHFVGRTVRVTISHWDARSRAHEAEGSGGGLYAVNIEVEDADADGGLRLRWPELSDLHPGRLWKDCHNVPSRVGHPIILLALSPVSPCPPTASDCHPQLSLLPGLEPTAENRHVLRTPAPWHVFAHTLVPGL